MMLFKQQVFVIGAFAALSVPSASFAWTRSYVVDWLEPAFYFGGPDNGSGTAPGTDCPKGAHPGQNWPKELAAYGHRDAKRVAEITDPEYPRELFKTHLAFRGPNKDHVFEDPSVVPDPGMVMVDGKLAEGIDLDDNPATGFTGIDGVPGVDNNFYKVTGCIKNFRAKPRSSFRFSIVNESMRNGSFQTVVVMSGEGDPMNDSDVTVGMYATKDRMVKDTNAGVVADLTYRIDPDPNYQTVFKAKIVNGVVIQQTPFFLRTHDNSTDSPQLRLYKTRIKWVMNPDGSISGLAGGYREFFEYYREKVVNGSRAGTNEDTGDMNMIAWYNGMRRYADGLPDPKTGKNRGISTAYRFSMVPAFVVNPGATSRVEVAQIFAPAGQ